MNQKHFDKMLKTFKEHNIIDSIVEEFYQNTKRNTIGVDEALNPNLVGLTLFDKPIIGYANVNDQIFDAYFEEYNIMFNKFVKPKQWLNSAKTVVSIFLPYSAAIKKGNSENMKRPSLEWLHGRYEGQVFINELSVYIQSKIEAMGHKCIIPSLDERLKVDIATRNHSDGNDYTRLSNSDFGSSWSERHVAYSAGLGTFGLSKNIITEKGSAGRLTSFITDIEFAVTQRSYTDVYEYCSFCGQCIINCPVNAISYEEGKKHTVCSRYIDWVLKNHSPRYACGKCQVKVPCQDSIAKSIDSSDL